MRRMRYVALAAALLLAACSGGKRARPVGVFDSGTGGLTGLEKSLT